MSRKSICRLATRLLVTTVALTAVIGPATAKSQGQPGRPNIIFVLVDDLPVDNFGVDNPRLQTPNFDRLIQQGTYVPRAAVGTSLCSPSRATILTGLTTRNHGIVDNQSSSEAGLTFFPKYLQKAGYQTAYFGKWHMGMDDDHHRPGFDRWVSFAGQGTYKPMGDFARPVQQVLNVDGKKVNRKDYITDELTDYQTDWLKRGRNKKKPFFIYMSHKAVHGPCVAPPRYAKQYSAPTMTLPSTFADTPENRAGKPMWVQNQRNSWHGIDIRHTGGAESMIEEKKACDAVLSAVDDSLGRTIQTLREEGLDKNTYIVFFSDNGSMWGAHGLPDKRNAYEESVRVPMFAWGMGIPAGVRSEARVRNLDLAPTFLSMAGVPVPKTFEGQNTLPLLQGKAAWKDWPQQDFVYEYYWEWAYPMTPTTFSIVHGNYKYTQYHGVWDREELYDLAKDPKELANLIEDPALKDLRVDLRRRLYAGLKNQDGKHTISYSERTNRGFVFRNKQGTPAAKFPDEWELDPPVKGDFQFFPLNEKASQE